MQTSLQNPVTAHTASSIANRTHSSTRRASYLLDVTSVMLSLHVFPALAYTVPEIQPDLPDEKALSRLCGEPIVAVVLPTNVFLNNNKGMDR